MGNGREGVYWTLVKCFAGKSVSLGIPVLAGDGQSEQGNCGLPAGDGRLARVRVRVPGSPAGARMTRSY